MIEKMKYINIIGHIKDLDLVINKYISKYDIQLEEALKEYKNIEKLENCITLNEYSLYFQKAEKFAKMVGIESNLFKNIEKEEALSIIDKANNFFEQRDENIKELERKREDLESIINKLKYYTKLEFDMSDFNKFEFIKFKFGKMPISNFKQFKSYLYDNINIIFVESMKDEKYVYCVYFFTDIFNDKIDNLLESLNFEVLELPFEFYGNKFEGSPLKIYKILQDILDNVDKKISILHEKTLFLEGITKEDILTAYNKIKNLYYNHDIRKYAAKTSSNFFVFVGWITEEDSKKLDKDMDNEIKFLLTVEDDKNAIISKPPTKLKNKSLFRPFEFFVRTYGIPKYNEIDPTVFLAITYTLIFGMMFGDLGQGAVISILGLILYRLKKLDIGLIMLIVGFSSMVFGVLYGSVFGFENLIPTLWIKPSENINIILTVAVCLGVILIFISMIFNLVNALKENNKSRFLFGANGLSGIIFYSSVIVMYICMISHYKIFSKILIIVFIVIPLILIAFKEPLSKKIEGKKKIIEGNKGVFLLEMFIELFEVLLTYFTNTLSFVRIGAFALSHAGMMGVVMLLSNNINGTHNPFIIILGNIAVIIIEGVVVSIQVLRIQFYEMFSRYYMGGGIEFKPYNKKFKDN